ncbi:GIY-YIG nuclease family protein [Draconibacterium sediminis]|uniref:GIY-YIG domain-containing protein n=1 Tax=Draconibacterium sediminis TaxID=1544798 RepID=A0A0D8J7Y8_9BACT|nr:GIY-YIG nuclease family protein [Draconibacterium sediminis]KJF41908.1 hypothetical protein LH29_21675 [Draconibacterium sediminis]
MKYYVYIIYSPGIDSYYKGQTSCLEDRLNRHNRGYEKATQHGAPWELVWSTTKPTRGEALQLEKKLKNLSREKTIEFIKKYS